MQRSVFVISVIKIEEAEDSESDDMGHGENIEEFLILQQLVPLAKLNDGINDIRKSENSMIASYNHLKNKEDIILIVILRILEIRFEIFVHVNAY